MSCPNHSRMTLLSPNSRSNSGAMNSMSSSVSLTSNTQIDGTTVPPRPCAEGEALLITCSAINFSAEPDDCRGMYAVQKTIPLSFKEQLQDQQLRDRVFALILSSMILFWKSATVFLNAEVLPRTQAIARLAMQRTTLQAPIKKFNIASQAKSTFRHLPISSH